MKEGARLDCLGKVKCSVGEVKHSILYWHPVLMALCWNRLSAQGSRVRWVSLKAGIAGAGMRGEKAGCVNCLWDDMAMEKKGHVKSQIFCKERTSAQDEHESDLESCVWL